VTLYYQGWDWIPGQTDGSWGEWYKWVFATFAAQHPGTKVEYVLVPFAQTQEKIISTVAANTPLDVALNSIVHGRNLFDKGALADIDSNIHQVPELAPANYFDVANFYRQAQGKLFGLSLYQDCSLLAVNSRLLREAQLDPKASDLKTWDDLVRYSDRLTKRTGDKITQLGFAFQKPGLEELATYVYANGGELQDAEVTKPLFNTAPYAARVADTLSYRATNYQRFGTNWAPELTGDLFKASKAAISYGGWGYQLQIRAGTYAPKDFEYWFVANPMGPSGTDPGVTSWVNMSVLPRGGKEPDLAFALARTAAGKEGQTQMFQHVNIEPSYKDFYQSKVFADGVRDQPVLGLAPQLFAKAKTYPFFRRFDDINKQVTPLLDDAIVGKTDVQQALGQAGRLAQQILST
jgi:ABC-type glycerol-3-phosphate transport system substrate-binding protein